MPSPKKITQLTATTAVDGDDLATTVVNVSTIPASRKIKLSNLLKQIFLAAGTKLSFTTIADGEFLKRDGTNITSAAVAPVNASYITQTASSGLSAEQAMGSLATGIVKNTTTTGVQSIAAAATDYVAPGAVTTSGLTQATARLLGRTTSSTGAIEEITVGSGLTFAAGSLAATGSATGLGLNAAHSVDDTYTGIILTGLNAGTTIAQWETVYLGGSSTWLLADANGSGTYPAKGLAVAAYVNTNPATILTYGTVRNDSWNWTIAGPLYLSGTAGGLTQTAPSTSGDQVQVVGYALTADVAFLDFNSTFLTVT